MVSFQMRAVDTVLAKLYTESEELSELTRLIEEPNEIVLTELEPFFTRFHRIGPLCRLYKQRGEDLKLLEAWSRYEKMRFSHPTLGTYFRWLE